MPSNSKNMKLSTKETSVPTKEVQPPEPPEPKSKKTSKTVTVDPDITVEATPQKGAGKTKFIKDDVETKPKSKPEPEPEPEPETETKAKTKAKVEDVAPTKLKGKSKATEIEVKVEDVAPVKTKSKGKPKMVDEPKEVPEEVPEEVPVQKAGGSKAKVTKTDKTTKTDDKPTKQTKQTKTETETTNEGETEIEKGVRSFKVQLPGTEDYIGRYTGLTPYQAANKALSKYFRENKTVKTSKTEIIFSIRESTRGSKRSTYTYNGKREKLETPVKYSINGLDGNAREIVKEYKNKLTKIKKGDAETETEVKVTST